jgi:hypothetical protein
MEIRNENDSRIVIVVAEEALLKLQYSVIGQRLMVIKIKRTIEEWQTVISRACQKSELQQRIQNMVEVLEHAKPLDMNYMNTQKQILLEHKRKLEQEEEQVRSLKRRVTTLEQEREKIHENRAGKSVHISKIGQNVEEYTTQWSSPVRAVSIAKEQGTVETQEDVLIIDSDVESE